MSGPIWLIIELDLDIIALHIFMQFGEDPMKFAKIIERKQVKKQYYDDSRAVTQQCLGRFG